jgi:hypothetical protein
MKTIYFGKVETEDTTDTFEHNGYNYYYKLEFDDETVLLSDTCNRAVPIDIEAISELLKAFTYLSNYALAQTIAKAWVSKSMSRLNKLYGLNLGQDQ